MKPFDLNKTSSTGRVFHIAGDGRRMSGLDNERRKGDLLITPDFQHAYMVMGRDDNRKLDGIERDNAIARARELHLLMTRDAMHKDLAKGKRVPVNVETVEQNVRRLNAERISGKHKVTVNPELNDYVDKDESIH